MIHLGPVLLERLRDMCRRDNTSQDASIADLVSIIIPAYNAAPYIKETLDSVFAQTYSDYEVIVVNDGSPDTQELETVLLPYRSRVTYITQANRGLAGARNTGLRAAKGALIALLDADDVWLPDYLQVQTDYLRDRPQNDLVYCNALFFGDSPYDGKEYMNEFPSAGEVTSAAIISRRCHVFVSIMARRDAMLAVGFDESLRSCEDFDCWIRFTARGYKIGFHRAVLVLYRKHKASLSANFEAMANYNIEVLNKSLTLWPNESEESRLLRHARDEKLAALETYRGKEALSLRCFADAKTHFRAANRYYQSTKLAAVIVLLGVLPWCVSITYRARAALFPAHRDI